MDYLETRLYFSRWDKKREQMGGGYIVCGGYVQNICRCPRFVAKVFYIRLFCGATPPKQNSQHPPPPPPPPLLATKPHRRRLNRSVPILEAGPTYWCPTPCCNRKSCRRPPPPPTHFPPNGCPAKFPPSPRNGLPTKFPPPPMPLPNFSSSLSCRRLLLLRGYCASQAWKGRPPSAGCGGSPTRTSGTSTTSLVPFRRGGRT